MNLLHDLDLCKDYDIYTPLLEKTTRGTYFSSLNLFLIKKASLASLKTALKQAKKLPRSHGIARVSYLRSKLTEEFKYFDELIEILKSDDDAWFKEFSDETYYLFERGDNTLINNMEKIRCVTNQVELSELTETLTNALNERTAKDQFPSTEIVGSYVQKSKYTSVVGNAVELTLAPAKLTKIEQDIVDILKTSHSTELSTLSSELLSKGYGKPSIVKSLTASPLVYIDKSEGRKHHRYFLVGRGVREVTGTPENDTYHKYRNRLAEVSKNGTDREHFGYYRIEQTILAEWLFGGKTKELCAICGHIYSVASLIAAHKKKRSDCSANERIDPYIVMPLCLFGCDYLYERGHLWISDGVVTENRAEDLTEHELAKVKQVVGKRIEERWLLGESTYFRRPT